VTETDPAPGIERVARVLVVAVLLMGVGVMVGWYADVPRLTDVLPGLEPMRPNTALCLLLLAGALWHGPGRLGRPAAAGVALTVALTTVTLVEMAAGTRLGGIDQLAPGLDLGGLDPRMAPATAVALTLLGIGLLLAPRGHALLAQVLAGLALLIGYIAIVGYLYGSSSLYAVGGYLDVALHTALSITALSLVVLLRARHGVAVLLSDQASAGRLVRVLLPFLLLGPPVVGALELEGRRNDWYDDNFGVGLLVVVLTVSTVALLVRVASRVRHADADLARALDVLSSLNRDLEEAVSRRTEALAAARARFEAAFASSPLGSALVSTDGCVEEVNRLLPELMGLTADALHGMDVGALFLEDGAEEDLRQRQALVAAGRGSYRLERQLRRPGPPCWVQVNVALVHDEQATRGLVYQLEDVTARKVAESRAEHMALHDSLTDLPNRVLLLDRLEQALAQAARTGRPVGVLFIDLDRFKVVNDSLGHHAGDTVLAEVGHRLRQVTRASDTVARLGGDEFVVLCTDVATEHDVLQIATTVREAVRQPIHVGGTVTHVDASVGIALGAGHEDADLLLRQADQAMYRAKDQGRDRFEVFDEDLRARVNTRLDTELALRGATERDEIETWFHPIVELETGQVTATEALVRWRRPDRGLVLPGDFVHVAEEVGLIKDIGTTVLRQATLAGAGMVDGPAVSVNVSAHQFVRSDFQAVVEEALALSGLAPQRLWLELTESAVVEAIDTAARSFQALRDQGVCIAIDDFGTGFSSFAHLRNFPVDLLKVDMAFVEELEQAPRDRAIVEGILRMADALHLDVVAEGIETTGQRDLLRVFGCRYGQGYLYSRPSPIFAPQVTPLSTAVPPPRGADPQRVERGVTRP
jgi:diguanylate cyclase (GGDEF)-like protein/PAS domain S-box-containing protein